jgi:superfamily II DNA or RNA helicase
VVEAATGTGKTAVAFAAIERLRARHGEDLRVAIVVPSLALARQWRRNLHSEVGIPPGSVGEQHSQPERAWAGQPILLTVINSARDGLAPVLRSWKDCPTLLIVDECHRAGSEFNALIFAETSTYALGLSATPERDDRGHLRIVYPALGPPVYSYPLIKALDDGVLAPLRCVNLYVDFTPEESLAWEANRQEVGDTIWMLRRTFPELADAEEDFLKRVGRLADDEEPLALKLVSLLATRRRLLSEAEGRQAARRSLLEWLAARGDRALVFHETIASAERSKAELVELGVAVSIDHSEMPKDERERESARFERGSARVYVAVRALDEGVDLPEAAVAVITAGTRSRRQRIQRFGRVLRARPDKTATVISVLVKDTPEEGGVGARDEELVGASRVCHHEWPVVSIDEACHLEQATYRPARPKGTFEEMVSYVELGIFDAGTAARFRAANKGRQLGQDLTWNPDAAFSVNAWHDVSVVERELGIPPMAFAALRAEARRAYRTGLDPAFASQPTMIYGEEVEAIKRRFSQSLRNQSRR